MANEGIITLSGTLTDKGTSLSGKLANAHLRGYSAYELAVQQGYEGTLEDWSASLDGFSPVVTVNQVENGHVVNIQDKQGNTEFTIPNGKDFKCEDFTQEQIDSLKVKGDKGDTPIKGVDYFTQEEIDLFKSDITPIKGIDYNDGYTPIKGKDYFTNDEIVEFKQDVTPIKGIDYVDGQDGYTPVKGKDYFTQNEIDSFKQQVTPKKDIDYFDGQDGYTPIKGEDYFTQEEITQFKNDVTPTKGTDYFTSDEVTQFKQEVTPAKGIDYYTQEEIEAIKKAIQDGIVIPSKVSELENDSGFINNMVNDLVNYYLKSEVYTKEEVQSLVGRISSLELIKVDALPIQDIKTSAIYLVPKEQSEENNIYTEYIYMDSKWETIGDTSVDLSQYALKTEIPTKLSQLQNDANYSQFSGSYNDLNDKPTIVGDVQANGASVVTDGVANIPWGDKTRPGLLQINASGVKGITRATSSPTLEIDPSTKSDIDTRKFVKPIVPTNLDYAVKAAMCDGKGEAWTDDEQAAGRERMGAVSSDEVTTMVTEALNAIGVAEEGMY